VSGNLLVELLLDDLFRLDQIYAQNTGALSNVLEKCKLAQIEEGSTSKEMRCHFKSFQGPKKIILFELRIALD